MEGAKNINKTKVQNLQRELQKLYSEAYYQQIR